MIKITTVVENTAIRAGFKAEHGLSIFIETEKGNILFDTGQSDIIVHNLKMLNIDLSRISKVVLSHGHYDHGGGMEHILNFTNPKVYAHPAVFRKRYSTLSRSNSLRYIGIKDRDFYESKGAFLSLDEKSQKVLEGIFTTGFVPMNTNFEKVDTHFIYKTEGVFKKDEIPDDLSLIIDTKYGLFIIFGCAHRGIINIINHAQKTFGKKVFGFIGGTHLSPASDHQRHETIKHLKGMGLSILAPLHCTGIMMGCVMYKELKGVVFKNVGENLTI